MLCFMLNKPSTLDVEMPFHALLNDPGTSLAASSSKYRTVLLNIDFVHEFSQYVTMSPLPWKKTKEMNILIVDGAISIEIR